MKNVGAVIKLATVIEVAGKIHKTPPLNFDGAS
jgi:hypothetical protein